jgi:hypothetical protein
LLATVPPSTVEVEGVALTVSDETVVELGTDVDVVTAVDTIEPDAETDVGDPAATVAIGRGTACVVAAGPGAAMPAAVGGGAVGWGATTGASVVGGCATGAAVVATGGAPAGFPQSEVLTGLGG